MSEFMGPLPVETVRTLIRWKVRRIAHRLGLKEHDQEDLAQDLHVRVLQALSKFDPARVGPAGPVGFVEKVLNNALANFRRDHHAEQRPGSPRSIDTTTAGGPEPLSQSLTQEAYDARRRYRSADPERAKDLALDITEPMARLAPSDQELIHQVKTSTISEAARLLGIPRSTLRSKLNRLRTPFEKFAERT